MISQDEYDKLFEAYQVKQEIGYCAKAVGISKKAAAKYITGDGNTEKGRPPIRDRWLDMLARQQEEQELTIIEWRNKEAKIAEKFLSSIHGEMKLMMEDVQRRVRGFEHKKKKIYAEHADDPDEAERLIDELAPEQTITLKALIEAYDKLLGRIEHLRGGPDLILGIEREDPLDSLTADEAKVYMERGILPPRVAALVTGKK